MLTKDQREELRALIEEQIRELQDDRDRQRENDEGPPTLDGSVGRLSLMDSLVNKQTSDMAREDEAKRLRRLWQKLERIDDPDFGRCAMCNEWISIERLRAAPDRGVCVDCLNKSHRQPGR